MRRRGFTLWETLAACLLLGALTTVSLQYFAGASAQRHEVYQRLTATQETGNLMERLAARPWEELATQGKAGLGLSPQAQQALPEGRFEVEVADATGTPAAKRVAVSVFWRPRPAERERKAELVAWRYKKP